MFTEYIELAGLAEADYQQAMKKAGEIIREGGLVAFPTETVYGLGADAMNPEACARIYEAKGRPSDNPLIVHIADFDQVDDIAREVSQDARKLMAAFWPGPLTVILPKKPTVPDQTTGGKDTVGIRMPSQADARAFIRESGRMIAAPSANTSGKPSPTRGKHVYDDMNGRIPMILDGGAIDIGIESTIVDMTRDIPTIVRPGYISLQQVADLLGAAMMDPAITGREKKKDVEAIAPGMKYQHYSPNGDMYLVEGKAENVAAKINELAAQKEAEGFKVGIIGTDETMHYYHSPRLCSVGSRQHPQTVAANLYDILREMDDLEADIIYSESFFEEEMGDAIMNRMLKAAAYRVITVN